MKGFLPLVSVFLVILSCNTTEKKDAVLFAGEIVNPSSAYVVLLKGRKVIDSAKLDGNNRFTFRLKSIEDGLYHFNHAPEFQYVFLEKGDSLQLRLNTAYFDESLVFSGTNEDVNNFLLEVFLSGEEEEQTIRTQYYNLEANEFTAQVNKLRNEKLKTLEAIKEESGLSEGLLKWQNQVLIIPTTGIWKFIPLNTKKSSEITTCMNFPMNFMRIEKI